MGEQLLITYCLFISFCLKKDGCMWFLLAVYNPSESCIQMRKKAYASRIVVRRLTEEESLRVIKFWHDVEIEIEVNESTIVNKTRSVFGVVGSLLSITIQSYLCCTCHLVCTHSMELIPTKAFLAGRSTVAIEHMRMMGFDHVDITRELKALLKTYGEDGWLFIESDAYKVLVEALLDAQERKRNNLGNEDLLEREPVDENAITVPEAADAGPSHLQPLSSSFLNAMAEQSEADIQAEGAGSRGSLSSPSPISPPHRSRKPCYGWICDDDEEEDEIITLSPTISRNI